MPITFDDMLNEQMKDDEFRKEYEAVKPEKDAIRQIADSHISCRHTAMVNQSGINHEVVSIQVNDINKRRRKARSA